MLRLQGKKAPRMGRCAVGILGLCTLILLQGVVGKVSTSSENGTEFLGKFPIYRVYERPGKDGVEFEFSDEHPLDMRPGDAEVWEAAGILVTLSESGLTYVKEVLVNRILEEITPLALPDIKVRTNSPIGHVDTEITKIELSGANVSYSDLDLGKTGITVFAGDIQAKLRLHWYYEYSATYVPFPINDAGWADVKVSGLGSSRIPKFTLFLFEKLQEKPFNSFRMGISVSKLLDVKPPQLSTTGEHDLIL